MIQVLNFERVDPGFGEEQAQGTSQDDQFTLRFPRKNSSFFMAGGDGEDELRIEWAGDYRIETEPSSGTKEITLLQGGAPFAIARANEVENIQVVSVSGDSGAFLGFLGLTDQSLIVEDDLLMDVLIDSRDQKNGWDQLTNDGWIQLTNGSPIPFGGT